MPEVFFVVPPNQHDELVRRVFLQRGYLPEEVEPMVRLCAESARHGIHTHNAIKAVHLDNLFGSRVGGCVPGAQLEELEVRFPVARIWNAHRKLGPGVAYAAMDKCVSLAEQYGLGMVSVDEAWHYLWGGAYVLDAARKGYIGYTNCTAMLAEVIPFGGKTPTLGTNPHSWAFPTTAVVDFPILVDWATSSVSMGRLHQFQREGKLLPLNSAVDSEGQLTNNPAQAVALLPFGAHKGYGLGLIDEIFAALIGGYLPTIRGHHVPDGLKHTPSFFFMAIHPEALNGAHFQNGVSQMENVQSVLRDILAHGNEGAILPGQIEANEARISDRLGGYLFSAAEIQALCKLAEECEYAAWNGQRFASYTLNKSDEGNNLPLKA